MKAANTYFNEVVNLEMAKAEFAETLENLQNSVTCILRSQNHV
jgi:hypothetical protein